MVTKREADSYGDMGVDRVPITVHPELYRAFAHECDVGDCPSVEYGIDQLIGDFFRGDISLIEGMRRDLEVTKARLVLAQERLRSNGLKEVE